MRGQGTHIRDIYTSLGNQKRLPGEDAPSTGPPGVSTNYSDEWGVLGAQVLQAEGADEAQKSYNGLASKQFLDSS